MDWSYILELILKAAGSFAAATIIGLGTALFAKLSRKINDSRIAAFVTETVKAAEQLYPNEGQKMGPEKYEYVLNQVLAKFPTLTDTKYLKSLIEGAVYTLSQQTKAVAKELAKMQQSAHKEISDSLTIN